MYRLKRLSLAVMFIAALGLAGCGGGGGAAVEEEMPPPPMPTPMEMACDAGPSEACVAAHMANVAEITGNPESTLAEVEAAQAALASAQSDLAAKQAADAAAMLEAEIAACGAAGGRWEEAGTCTSAEELAEEQAAADLAEALIPYQERTAAALAATKVAAATAQEEFDAISGADPKDENYKDAKAALDNANRRVTQAETEHQRALNAESVAAAAEAARSAEIRQSQAEGQIPKIIAAVEAYNAALATANEKLGRAMRAALVGPDPATDDALDNIGASGAVLSATGSTLTIDIADNAGTLTETGIADAVLNRGDSVGSLGGWNGTGYSHSTGKGAAKVDNDAVVYTNQGPGKFTPIEDVFTVFTGTTDATDIKGYITLDETTDLPRIKGDIFTHSGTQNHEYDSVNDAAFTARGTYAGAHGEYRCTGACSSTNDGKGSPSALGGVWHFKPDADAMVHEPDAHYLYFGWWVNKGGGDPTVASAFAMRAGVEEADDGIHFANNGNLATLTGSASYVGHAVGKFSIVNTLAGTGDAGHFTADARLEAIFSSTDPAVTAGVTGTIDNFRLNDGSENPGWEVSLARGGLGASDGEITSPAQVGGSDVGTIWSINGNAAPASGTWSGTMYDETIDDNDDGSNIPTTVTGTFYSEFTAQGIGRMVGAFGADVKE